MSKVFVQFMLKKIASYLIYLFFLAIVIEGALRLQQKWGPLYDFEFPQYSLDQISETLNHKPAAGQGYNEDGIWMSPFRKMFFTEEEKATTILFMGDSFMHGYPDHYSIPDIVGKNFHSSKLAQENISLLNAGYSSYSPAIYIPQAKELIPKYKPDFLVIAIDESDLVDDYASYRSRVVLDQDGKIMGVRSTPVYVAKVKGILRLKEQPSYLCRLILLLWHKGIRIPIMVSQYKRTHKKKYYENKLSDSTSRFSYNLVPAFDFESLRYEDEKVYFERNVRELIETLTDLMGTSEKILVLYHPHLHHLTPDARGFTWRQNVKKILERVTESYRVPFYDLTDDMRQAFGEDPNTFYFENDMHFNYDGFQVYGDLVTEKLKQMRWFSDASRN